MTGTDLDLLYRELDADPQNHTLLGAIADYHEEQGTGLSRGLQALIACGRVPWWARGDKCWYWFTKVWYKSLSKTDKFVGGDRLLASLLPIKLVDLIEGKDYDSGKFTGVDYGSLKSGSHLAYLAAAKAFNLLTPDQQTRLLAGDLDLDSN